MKAKSFSLIIPHSRHLKLDKTHYLDNEYVGILVKVSLADFTPPEVTPASTTDSTTDADSHARASDEGDDQSSGVRSSNSLAVSTPLSTTDEDSPSSEGRDDQMKSTPSNPVTKQANRQQVQPLINPRCADFKSEQHGFCCRC